MTARLCQALSYFSTIVTLFTIFTVTHEYRFSTPLLFLSPPASCQIRCLARDGLVAFFRMWSCGRARNSFLGGKLSFATLLQPDGSLSLNWQGAVQFFGARVYHRPASTFLYNWKILAARGNPLRSLISLPCAFAVLAKSGPHSIQRGSACEHVNQWVPRIWYGKNCFAVRHQGKISSVQAARSV